MSEIEMIRNIGLFGHSGSGKTSLAEAMLFTAGKCSRLGKVDDATSCMDFEPEEQKRNSSMSSSFNNYSWKKHTVILTDTPGDDNFINDAKFSAIVSDGAIFTIGAVLGVKHQTEKFAAFLMENRIPTIICITKMDRDRADFKSVVTDIEEKLPQHPAIIQLPIGAEKDFRGVIDLIDNQAYLFGELGKMSKTDIPPEMVDEVKYHRESLMEIVAETDDDLIEKFLEEGQLSKEEILRGLKKGVITGQICPVVTGSMTNNQGTELLLDCINNLLPSPNKLPAREGISPKNEEIIERLGLENQPFSALVFKSMADPYAGKLTIFRVFSGTIEGDTFYNSSKDVSEKFGQLLLMEGKESRAVKKLLPGMIGAVAKLKETSTGDTICTSDDPIVFERPIPLQPSLSYAVHAEKQENEDKLFSAISKLLEEDPTLKLTREPQTNEILISGIGQIHLQMVGEKIKRKFGVNMTLQLPKIPYRETIKKGVSVQYKHKKQSGGRGQYAENYLEINPLPSGGGFEFEDKIVGGVIPKQYIPAIEKGVIEAMGHGVVAGYQMVDIKVGVFDGSFHNVDSSEMAFKIAGSQAFKKGTKEAEPVLLEPIMTMTIEIPEECVGDIIGDVNSRRGKVMGMDSGAKNEQILAQVPMAEIQEYTLNLTAITGGRGSFSSTLSHYQEVPKHITEQIVAAGIG